MTEEQERQVRKVGWWRMMRAAGRRFVILVLVVAGGTALVSLVLGLLAGSNLGRAVSLGLYLVGSLLTGAGVLIGSRGPARSKNARFESLIGPRLVRWATPEEQEQTLSDSAIFVTVGLILIAFGLVVDGRHAIF